MELKRLIKCVFHSMRHIHDSDKATTGKPFLPVSEIEPLCVMMNKVLTIVETVKVETYQAFSKAKNFDFDEEDMQEFKDEVQKTTKAASYIMELSG